MSDPAAESTAQTIYDGHIIRVEKLEGRWEVVRHADAVALLVLNEQGEMLCVRQQRPAVGALTLEVPAGLIDPGESPEQAARRELQEEAGFDADVTLLSRFYASPGFSDELLYLFRAENLRESRLPMDDDEDIEVVWRSPAEVLAELRDGRVTGAATTVTAALFGLRALEGAGEGQA
ncbi:DNA mismatch repair protein MutT [Deinococcus piscis]|uniref:DNA mismatch repair protein MutT n=1 Tax=Deinococcus piscis TaxID=394230 RepID=A0ABQ3K9Z7_9DEIO|nr:NUDIX hydrolase [Deinococcus piscis]GHG08381.1 DNA mismatch repair protein MutT [Deinococcus piscis]